MKDSFFITFMNPKLKSLYFIPLVLLGLFFVTLGAKAEDPKLNISHETMAAKYVSQSIPDPITIEAGKSETVILKFKNVGTENWPTDGRGFISAYTVEPKYRNSDFSSKNWISLEQTGPISKITKPGNTADLAIVLKAPEKVGDYTEEFHLASENYTWVKDGYFFLKIKVVEPKVEEVVEENPSVVAQNKEEKAVLSVSKFIQNPKTAQAEGGERIKLIVGFQNTGKEAWKNYSIVAKQPVTLASNSKKLSFADELWQSANLVVKQEKEVPPGGYLRETFYVRAPAEEGEYEAKFYLQVEDEIIESAYAALPITVTSNAPDHYVPAHSSTTVIPPVSYTLETEPRIRVGLWQPESYVQFRSTEASYDVYAGTVKKGTLSKNKLAILMRKNGQYYFRGGGLEFYSNDYIRLSPVGNPHAIFSLLNYNRHVTWKGPNNFNTYRGAIEFRMGEVKKDSIWVVNDLLLEDYMMGIGENGNMSPPQYLRSQAVAQRSYAYATILSDKYGIFDVVATTGDQLYLGVECEKIMGNFVAGVKETRGQMVTYDNNVVITPYFAHAVCRTRSWTETWGGTTKPWLVPVKTNYDCKYYGSFLGHGVGMSQMDASRRATAEDLSWQELVKYYYTGVEIKKMYE